MLLRFEAKPAGRLFSTGGPKIVDKSLFKGVKSDWSNGVEEIGLDVDLADLSATSLPSIPVWLGIQTNVV